MLKSCYGVQYGTVHGLIGLLSMLIRKWYTYKIIKTKKLHVCLTICTVDVGRCEKVLQVLSELIKVGDTPMWINWVSWDSGPSLLYTEYIHFLVCTILAI